MKENKQQKGILLENFEEKEGETVSQDYLSLASPFLLNIECYEELQERFP